MRRGIKPSESFKLSEGRGRLRFLQNLILKINLSNIIIAENQYLILLFQTRFYRFS